MPTDEAPIDVNEPQRPAESLSPEGCDAPGLDASGRDASGAEAPGAEADEQKRTVYRGSRWVDYDTHELLEMISELEDERRWARLREGLWLAILFHLALLSALTWIPRYVFKTPKVLDPFDAIQQRKDLTYLDMPPDALKQLRPKVVIKPIPQKDMQIDRQTLEQMKRQTPPPAAQPPAPVQAKPAEQPIPPVQQSHIEAPRPAAVPARPNFAMNNENPADQLRQEMENAAHNHGVGPESLPPAPAMPLHPDSSMGGVQILSDTQGVDFSNWVQRWRDETQRTWDPLTPDEVNPPINKRGEVLIDFKVLPNGRLMDGSVKLEGSSGDVALDRAAWGALTGSNYPPLPQEFHGPYVEFRALFIY